MKKLVALVSLVVVFSWTLSGFCFWSNGDKDKGNGKSFDLEQIFNEGKTAGYKIGYDVGYAAGYRDALNYFKELIRRYEAELNALDAGRVLLREWYVSYPQVYQVVTPNGIEVRVLGCKPIRPLSEEILSKLSVPVVSPPSQVHFPFQKEQSEAFSLPSLPPSSLPPAQEGSFNYNSNQFSSHSLSSNRPDFGPSSSAREPLFPLLKSEVELRKPIVKKVSKRYLPEVQRFGYPYEVTEDDYLRVYFQNESQAKTFCLTFTCKE